MADVFDNTTTNVSTNKRSLGFASAYAGVGTGGILANLFILTVVLTDKKLLKQSAIMVGIAISHLLCAMAIGVSGIYRINNFSQLNDPLSSWGCVFRIYPTAQPFAFQSMGAMLVVVGVERFCVFVFPNWYRTRWTTKICWEVIGAAYSCVLVSFCVGLYFAWYQPLTTLYCSYASIFGKSYIVYSSVVSALGGTIAVSFTLFGLLRGTRQAKTLPIAEASKYKRQLKLTRSMLSVAVCDFCLVVIPNALYVLDTAFPGLFPAISGGNLSNFTNLFYCVNTLTSIVPYLAFNRQFRASAFRFFPCKDKPKVGTATTIQVSPMEMY